MKKMLLVLFFFALVVGLSGSAVWAEEGYGKYIKPVTNPVYFDEPYNQTYVHVFHAYQNLPDRIDTILGKVPLDGRLNLTALRLNYAVNDCLSIVAAKDGYIDFDPKNTLDDETGWGDIAGGVKYSFLRDPDHEVFFAGELLFEFTQGSRDVFQGNGDGNMAPSIHFMKGCNGFQFNGTLGGIIPFNNGEESAMFFDSWHVSYALFNYKLFPLMELNHFHVVDTGGRDELVASIVKFEGGDVINLGASHANDHKDFVSLAFGFRYRVIKPLDFGFAYEFPLTKEENGLMSDRLNFDLIYHF